MAEACTWSCSDVAYGGVEGLDSELMQWESGDASKSLLWQYVDTCENQTDIYGTHTLVACRGRGCSTSLITLQKLANCLNCRRSTPDW